MTVNINNNNNNINNDNSNNDTEENRASITQPQSQSQSQSVLAIRRWEEEEKALLRECHYALQGIDGDRIRFRFYYNSKKEEEEEEEEGRRNGIRIRSSCLNHPLLLEGNLNNYNSILESGINDVIYLCGEIGYIYVKIQNYVIRLKQRGSIGRALSCSIMKNVLVPYKSFITDIIQYTCIRDLLGQLLPTCHLQIITRIMDDHDDDDDEYEYVVGGADLLTLLHQHKTIHYNSNEQGLIYKLLQEASEPWYQIIFHWVMEGRLIDPGHEFFVFAQSDNNKNNNNNIWQDGYGLDTTKVPSYEIISKDDTDLIFSVGKGVNYIRKSLQHGEWSLEEQLTTTTTTTTDDDKDTTSKEDLLLLLGFSYGQTIQLRNTLQQSASIVHTHILQTLHNEHHLVQHLYALKQFLLLGQGDFFSSLIELIHTEYNNTANTNNNNIIYRHNLVSVVDSALHSTNATNFSQDVLNRLSVELLFDKDSDSDALYTFTQSKRQNDNNNKTSRSTTTTTSSSSVWDVFSLDYLIPEPLTAIVHTNAMNKYRQLFHFLFRLNRVEFMLNYMWKQSAVLQRALHANAQYMNFNMSTNKHYAQAITLLRQVSTARQSMVHFVQNLKTYMMLEVVESGWERLLPDIQQQQEDTTTTTSSSSSTNFSLDYVILAHDRYLDGILRKSLLLDNDDNNNNLDLAGKLHNILSLACTFYLYQEELFEQAMQSADRAAEKRRHAEILVSEHGSWGFVHNIDANDIESCFGLSDTTKYVELNNLTQTFNEHTHNFLKALDIKLNGKPAWDDDDYYEQTKVEEERHRSSGHQEYNNKSSDLYLNYEDDLDHLRFLMLQLDNNRYYGVANV